MNTMEVLTLLLVIFAALSYIDYHNGKKKQHPQPSQSLGCYSCNTFLTEGKSEIASDHLSKQIIQWGA